MFDLGCIPWDNLREKVCEILALVSVIILSHRCDTGLVNTIDSLRESVFRDYEITIVDNGSRNEGTRVLEQLKELQLPLKVIRLDKNFGTTVGYNIGIRASQSELIAFLHDDVSVSPQWLGECVKKLLENPKNGAVQGKVYLTGSGLKLDTCGCVVDRHCCEHDRGQGEIDNGQYDRDCEVFSVSGVASVFRRKAVELAGYLDENFLSGLDDLDLCWRIRLGGFRIFYIHNAIAYHQRSATWNASFRLRRMVKFEFAKTRIYVPFKNFELRNFFLNLPVLLLHFAGGAFLCLIQRDVYLATTYPKALLWFLVNLPQLSKERLNVQLRIRSATDKDVFSVSVCSCNLVNYTIRTLFK
jgi:GT2 family glycosyltransferase